MFWVPDRRWAGKDVFAIGGGSSLRDFDWSRLSGKPTIGCNVAYKLGPSLCNVCLFSDLGFYEKHCDGLAQYAKDGGFVVTHCPELVVSSENNPEWLHLMRRQARGLYLAEQVGYGNNTGAGVINIALSMGARRVLLLGYDCKAPDPKHPNWHDEYKNAESKDELYAKFMEGFRSVRLQLFKFKGSQVINLGPDSALNHFARSSIDLWL